LDALKPKKAPVLKFFIFFSGIENTTIPLIINELIDFCKN